MKRPVIGILGGISAASTAEYYLRIIKKSFARRKDHYYPEIAVYSLDFQTFTDLENGPDRKGHVDYVVSGLDALERAGADFAIMAANSVHSVFDDVRKRTRLPLVSIVQTAAAHAKARGMKKVLLLGIKHTMNADFYPDAFAEAGIAVLTPDRDEKEVIERIIFDELSLNMVTDASRKKLLAIIARYSVDGVILGCTELPLILKQKDSPKTLIDTLDLHVEAALDFGRLPTDLGLARASAEGGA